MGFAEAVRTVYKDKYFTFSGRASRSEYWWSFLALLLAGIMLGGVVLGVFTTAESFSGTPSLGLLIPVGIAGILYLALLIPSIAVAVRRLHDRNMSGWWYLGFTLVGMVPYVGWIFNIVLFVILALKGTEGDNKYGANPLTGIANPEVFA